MTAANWFAAAVATFGFVALITSILLYVRTLTLARRTARIGEQQDSIQKALESLEWSGSPSRDDDRTGSPWRNSDWPVEMRPLPVVPAELLHALAAGRCVLFLGTGASINAGFPSRREILIRALLGSGDGADEGRVEGLAEVDLARLDERDLADFGEIRLGRQEYARRVAKTALAAEGVLAATAMSEDLLRLPSTARIRRPGTWAPPLHKALATLPVAGLILETWDNLHVPAIATKEPVDLGTGDSVDPETITSGRFFTMRLFGSAEDSESLLLSSRELQAKAYDQPTFRRSLASLASRYSILFVGATASAVQDFAEVLGPGLLSMSRYPHFALTPSYEGYAVDAELLSSLHRVECIPLDPGDGFHQLVAYIDKLSLSLEQNTGDQPTSDSERRDTLRGLSLTNIGPFNSLSLRFEPGWNVLLGDNGVGKTTVLRAVAFVLSRTRETTEYGDQFLLSADSTDGLIEVEMDSGVYSVRLVRDGDRVRCLSRQITPVESGAFLVLGFPAIRGISVEQTRGPRYIAPRRPGPYDVDPLARNTLDARLDNLKQWIVNLAVSDDHRSRSTLDRFFEVLDALVPGPKVAFAGVDRKTWDVLVRTPDGLVPIERVSQGMSSVLSWCGVLVQRINDLESGKWNTRDHHALVLVDELDAHLHPAWQRRVVGILRQQFPLVQFIVTSHSPLVVANMNAREVAYFSRENDGPGIVAHKVDKSFKGMDAEQILLSAAFDLPVTSDTNTEEELREYGERITSLEPSTYDQERIADLGRRLLGGGALGPEGTVKEARSVSGDEERRLRDAVRAQLEQLTREGGDDADQA